MGELHPQGGFSFRKLIGSYGFEAVPERRPKANGPKVSYIRNPMDALQNEHIPWKECCC